MAYRETCQYVVLCDRCGAVAPQGAGWWTPAIADQAAVGAGWHITRTEHLCPACRALEKSETDEAEDANAQMERPALPPVAAARSLPDVLWCGQTPAPRSVPR